MKSKIKKMMHKTPRHYSYHAKSYSAYARELCDRAIDNVNCGAWCVEQAVRFFILSYRCSCVRLRALNRFKRYLKNGKIHEHPESILAWNKYKEENSLVFYEQLTGQYMTY